MVTTGNFSSLPQNKPAQILPEKLLHKKRKAPSFRIYSLIPIIEKIITRLKDMPEIKTITCASDYRRKKEIISDLNVVIITDQLFPRVKKLLTKEQLNKIGKKMRIFKKSKLS